MAGMRSRAHAASALDGRRSQRVQNGGEMSPEGAWCDTLLVMRWQISWQGVVFAIVLFGTGLFVGSYVHKNEPIHSTVDQRLQPAVDAASASAISGTIYVPVYSTLFLGTSHRASTVDLAATVSIRNVSAVHPITLDAVRYYDSVGKPVRDYLEHASTLPAMGSVEFVIQRSDTTGGPGANFLVRWHAAAGVEEPLVEAIMLGQSGNGGISFSSRGRALTSPAER
jgi:hypothetical protein